MGLKDARGYSSCGTTVIEGQRTVLRLRKPAQKQQQQQQHDQLQQKGKLSITPPSSPTSLSSFSSKPIGHNGYYDNPALSPRLSDSDSAFQFLDSRKFGDTEVFTITNGTPNKTNSLSNKSTTSEVTPGVARGNSTFSEDKYKWTDNDVTDGDRIHRKSRSRKLCLILLVIVLVLGILAGVAVILAVTVFKDKGEDTVTTQSTVAINLEGSLDLQETWTVELDDPTSTLYRETEDNFIREMDALMQQSNLSESYIGTNVLGFSPGSIKVDFKMAFNDKYRLKLDTDKQFAERVEQEIHDAAEKTPLRIVRDTIRINPHSGLTEFERVCRRQLNDDTIERYSTATESTPTPSTVSTSPSTVLIDSSIVPSTTTTTTTTAAAATTTTLTDILTSLTHTDTSSVSSVVVTTSSPTRTSVFSTYVSDSVLSSNSDTLPIESSTVSPLYSSTRSVDTSRSLTPSLPSSHSFSVSSDSLFFPSSLSITSSQSVVKSSKLPSITYPSISSTLPTVISTRSSKYPSTDMSNSIISSLLSTSSTGITMPTHFTSRLDLSSQFSVSTPSASGTDHSFISSTFRSLSSSQMITTKTESYTESDTYTTSHITTITPTPSSVASSKQSSDILATQNVTTPHVSLTMSTSESSFDTTMISGSTITYGTGSTLATSMPSLMPTSSSTRLSTQESTTSMLTPITITTLVSNTLIQSSTSTLLNSKTEETRATSMPSATTSRSTNSATTSIITNTPTLESTTIIVPGTSGITTRILPSTTILGGTSSLPSTDMPGSTSGTMPRTTSPSLSSTNTAVTTAIPTSTTISLPSTIISATSTETSTTSTEASSLTSTTASTTTEAKTTQSSTTTEATTTTQATTTTIPTTTTEAPDRPPKANAGEDIYINLPTNTVILYASGSSDDRGIVEYKWTQVSSLSVTMEGANTEELTLSGLQEGDYVFRLTVRDESKQSSSDIVRVYVLPELCMEVPVEACRNLGYTRTQFPNILGQEDEAQAIQVFKQKSSSIHNQICQNVALSYICSLYFPLCNDTTGYLVFPCRSLCEEAVASCSEYFINPIYCDEWDDYDCIEPPTMPTTTAAPAPTCEETLEQDCINLGFNYTSFPNLLDETIQADSLETYDAYLRWIAHMGDDTCHPDVGYFICGSQFPLCVDGKQKKPCRRFCEEVVASCEDVSYYFYCDLYPEIDCIAPAQPVAECRANQFTCSKITKCVDTSKVCDGVNDCADWSDEMDCQCDGQYEYQCKMGMCIKSFQECDGVSQCPDNSDELHCDGCRNGQVRCPNTDKCIMREWLCDGQNECDDGWDEWHCDRCSRSNFTCQLDRSCIPMSKRCDGRDDCSQGEDEWDCVKQEGDMLQLRHQKLFLPICAESWSDMYGNYTCQVLLGEGPFIESSEVLYNGLTFAKLQPDGNVPSLLGNITMAFDCLDNKAIHINCKPRGCGKRILGHTNYIANGEDAAHGNWPWHAALYMGNIYFCGGTLINEQFVITAAHCVEKYTGDFRSKMTVKLGANNRNKSEVTQRVISVQAISSHSMHVWFERNDIALLQLANPVNYTEYIQPVCLPDENEPLPLHSECWTIGWGKTKWDADYAEVLQQLKMTLWDTQKCNSSIAWNGEVYDTFLCAGYYSGIRSICKGDSGGPLLCLDKQQVWRLIGINSYVANFCNMTARPNIFTDVKYFLPWIDEITECKFRCDNGKCLYSSEAVCNREDNCGDNSDEIRECKCKFRCVNGKCQAVCNREDKITPMKSGSAVSTDLDSLTNYTAACSFDDQFLCGYNWTGWGYGFDNKKAVMIELDGQFHTQSYAPQFDNTYGSLPGYFFYGKLNSYTEARLWSPKFKISGMTCIRFAYYLRGDITDGLIVNMLTYNGADTYTTNLTWGSPIYMMGADEWRTGYFNVPQGEYQLEFRTVELLKVAVDDVKTIPGLCQDVLCDPQLEYRCRSDDGLRDKCIPKESRCNLVIDCDNGDDELACTGATNSYMCTFDNGNICGLRQNVGDASDWWLTNGTFVRDESLQQTFEDHTSNSQTGRMLYMNSYNLQSTTAIYMSQYFYLHSLQHCLSFYYIRKADVNFTVHIHGEPYATEQYSVMPTFYGWTLFQVILPQTEVVNVTYDIKGLNITFYSYVVMDDVMVKPGNCPYYDCPVGYTKCDTVDRCFPGRARCDRTVDCQDESDEANCECTAREFRCTNGRCIPDSKMCDRTVQCLDGSDEQACVTYENVTCNFEHPYLCGYEFQSYSKYSWRRFKGRTYTPVTGPQFDHTLGNEKGYYVYTEASEGSHGDNATVRSPQFYSGYGNSIEFWYHSFSSQPYDTRPGALMFILDNTDTGIQTIKWSSNNDLVDAWRRLCFDLPTGETLIALFTALRNETSDYGVDFAIDDVKYNGYRCSETPERTTPWTMPTTTTGPVSTHAMWYCDNGQGIDASYRCDRETDCMDGSDERDCPP